MEKVDRTRVIFMVLIAILSWIGFTTLIERIKHPEMTETQVFMHIPQSATLNFKE